MGEESRSPIGTPLAESCELGHLIGQWNTIQNLGKGLASPVSVKTHHYNITSLLVHQILDEIHKSRKELGLFDDHKLVGNIHRKLLKHLPRVPHHAGNFELIVGHNTRIASVSLVNVRLNDENREIQRPIPVNQMVDLG